MKKAVIKDLRGEVIDFHESKDPSLWIIDGLQHGKWGKQGEFTVAVVDIEKLSSDSQVNRVKRETLARDFDALLPHRQDRLKSRIFKWVLQHSDINVEDI